ncbi:hypothetical protein PAMP_001144 [Pampus punctatissimus]
MESCDLDSQQHHQNKSIFSNFGDLDDLKQRLQRQLSPAQLPGSDPAIAVLGLPALNNPNVQQAFESLHSLIKATKEKRTKSDGSGTSQTSSDKHKAGDNEDIKEKQARISKMEFLMKEMEGLLKHDGLSFLTPVIRFYCHKCEEFIGDLNSAKNHAAIHRHSNSSSMQMDKHPGDCRGHSRSSNQHPHPTERRDHSCHGSHRDLGDHRNLRGYQQNWRDDRDHSKHDDARRKISPWRER